MADEEWLAFIKAVSRVSCDRNVAIGEAEALLRAAIKQGAISTALDHQLAAALRSTYEERQRFSALGKRSTSEADPTMRLLAEGAAQASLEATLAEHPLINKTDLEN
jgi:hypothetical protein